MIQYSQRQPIQAQLQAQAQAQMLQQQQSITAIESMPKLPDSQPQSVTECKKI